MHAYHLNTVIMCLNLSGQFKNSYKFLKDKMYLKWHSKDWSFMGDNLTDIFL